MLVRTYRYGEYLLASCMDAAHVHRAFYHTGYCLGGVIVKRLADIILLSVFHVVEMVRKSEILSCCLFLDDGSV